MGLGIFECWMLTALRIDDVDVLLCTDGLPDTRLSIVLDLQLCGYRDDVKDKQMNAKAKIVKSERR